ncbi:MAG TPA: MarC family protein [Geminicoccus sp.]|uniref:MarC family protein n=1 Tax=Geminicoccus sp. TaxID=2024832 RepID=UPI002C7AF873|nr:MarC family protein [Geminicoccus sp.]HWL68894.1 MarC family protein [Geminicoccus sp.]
MPELLSTFATALVAFLVIIDPLGLVPIFIALTRNADPEQRQRMALKAVVVAACVLVAFALVGENLLRSIGIGIPAFRIAGGILLLLVALEMVFERRTQRRENTADHLADERMEGQPVADISVFPMAVPLLAGPGAITTVILHMGSRADSWPHQAAVMAALLVTLLVVAISLFLASRLGRFLGPTLISVFSRLLGLLLSALAVQFIIDGIKRAFGI